VSNQAHCLLPLLINIATHLTNAHQAPLAGQIKILSVTTQ